MYGQQNQQQRQPRKPGSGRVWPAKKRTSPNSPHFTGDLTLMDGHVVRVSIWESTDRQGTFNGFSLKLSEDTRQGNGYQAQGGYGNPNGYGQQPNYGQPTNGHAGGYAPQNGYGAPQNPPNAPAYTNGHNGPQQPYAPPTAYQRGDEGYVPGFDD